MAAGTADLSIRRESLLSAASNVVLVVVNLATLAMLARALGGEGLGTYFYALAMSFIAIIPSRELSQIMRKRVSEVDSPSAEYFGLAQAGTAIYLALFAGGLILVAPPLVAHTPMTASVILAFGVYTAVLTQSAMSTRLYDAVGSPGASMISQSIRETAFLGGVVALLWLGTATPASILLVRAGIHLVTAFAIYVVVGIAPRLPSRRSLRRGMEFGKWSAPTGVASHFWEQAPSLLMGVVLGSWAVALYESAKRVTTVGAYLATCINDPLLVKVSALGSVDEEVITYVRLAMDYTPAVAIPALFLMAPVAPELLAVAAGPEYVTGGFVLVCIAATHVLSGVKTPITAAIHGVDRPRYVFYLTVATLFVGVPAIALGAMGGGVAGVAFVLVALELAGVLVTEVAAFYAFGQFVVPETMHVQVGAATAGGAVVWAASTLVDLTAVVPLVAVLALGAAVHYALFALASEQFRNGTVRTLRDVTRVLGSARPT